MIKIQQTSNFYAALGLRTLAALPTFFTRYEVMSSCTGKRPFCRKIFCCCNNNIALPQTYMLVSTYPLSAEFLRMEYSSLWSGQSARSCQWGKRIVTPLIKQFINISCSLNIQCNQKSSLYIILSIFSFGVIFFQNQLFRKKIINTTDVKQFRSRLGPTFCRAWSGSKQFAKVISWRFGKSPLVSRWRLIRIIAY